MRGEEKRAGGEGCVATGAAHMPRTNASTLPLLPLIAGLRQVLPRVFDTIYAYIFFMPTPQRADFHAQLDYVRGVMSRGDCVDAGNV
jgi:hypothetical protein